MINQNLSLKTNEKCIFVTVDEIDYVAIQNIDECDIDESIADDVEGYTATEDIILHVDTDNSGDFGCNFMWYEYCGYSDGVEISVQSNFWGTRPNRPHQS